jgi:hypothetical protein
VADRPDEPSDLLAEEERDATIVAIMAWMIRLPEPGRCTATGGA